jgi:hypothetical protein
MAKNILYRIFLARPKEKRLLGMPVGRDRIILKRNLIEKEFCRLG